MSHPPIPSTPAPGPDTPHPGPDAPAAPWLTLVGIGEDGWAGLNSPARQAVLDTDLLVGGLRHLALVADHAPPTDARRHLPWPQPLEDAFPALLAAGQAGQRVTVLASGDPHWFGIGATLARTIPADQMLSHPAPGAFTLAAARMGWAVQDVACLSLHGRPLDAVVPHLAPGARLALLSWDAATPRALGTLLRDRGYGASPLTVLERMGGAAERRRTLPALQWADCADAGVADLNTVALTCVAGPGARALPRSPGLPDAWYAHDGKITKREVRAVVLSLLAPLRGELLWDVGAGSGSIALEWLLADPANQATAVEEREERLANLRANALTFGASRLRVLAGRAPDALTALAGEVPDAVFIGGGLSTPGMAHACWQALRPGGRLVASAVTLEGEVELIQRHKQWGGELLRISVERADALGTGTVAAFRGWRPLMPVTLLRAQKP